MHLARDPQETLVHILGCNSQILLIFVTNSLRGNRKNFTFFRDISSHDLQSTGADLSDIDVIGGRHRRAKVWRPPGRSRLAAVELRGRIRCRERLSWGQAGRGNATPRGGWRSPLPHREQPRGADTKRKRVRTR